VIDIAKNLTPSARGELEITDVNRVYMDQKALRTIRLGQGIAWLDSGTHDSLLEAANFIATIERRQGLKIACLEEIAYQRGYVDLQHLTTMVSAMPPSTYREYLQRLLVEDSSQS
jgi:glucose-1-phosphate thymidylyltransferase